MIKRKKFLDIPIDGITAHYSALGGPIAGMAQGTFQGGPKNINNIGGFKGNSTIVNNAPSPRGSIMSGIGGIASSVAGPLGSLASQGMSSGVGDALSTVGGIASNIPGIGGIIGAGTQLLGGIVNGLFGSKMNTEFINQTEGNIKAQSGIVSDASSNEELMSDFSDLTSLGRVSKSQVGKEGLFSNKAKNKTAKLNKQIEEANAISQNSLANTATNIDTQNDLNILANYSALGGPIIKKGNTFMDNIKGWQHANGGILYTNGANWTNGLTHINEGGTHEENPYDGIPMSRDEQGKPNLVEEGETLFNDYVFSDRLKASKGLLATYKLPTSKADKTFSEIAKSLGKESEERPNDAISNNGLEISMNKLIQAQEELRAKEGKGNTFAKGGPTKEYMGYTPIGTSGSNLSFNLPNYSNSNRMAMSFLDDEPIAMNSKGQVTNLLDAPTQKSMRKTYGKPKEDGSGLGLDSLRYLPALGAGAGVIGDLFGANKPNYSNAELIEKSIRGLADIKANPVGNYLGYNPLDRDYYINKLNANAGATRRSIMNTSGGNRASAQAGILAADYNYGNNLGNLARQAEESNQQQKERVEGFNRQTNMFNSESALRAAGLNRQADELKFRAIAMGAQMRDQADTISSQVRSQNLTNLFDSLGDIGREQFTFQQIKDNPALAYYADQRGKTKYKSKDNKKSKGGKIKEGLTY